MPRVQSSCKGLVHGLLSEIEIAEQPHQRSQNPARFSVDTQWKDHLLTLDHVKEGIGLRGYGQKDPLVEFKKEAFTLFEVEGAGGQRQNAVT